jgi:NAD(P)-dependent dehydrogenase (short-subunit alcohol dehydrogenase family)
MQGGSCEGRVVIVTGAGRGLGRAHAIALAGEGARVVVNDTGSGLDGSGRSSSPAEAVLAEVLACGGDAMASGHDVADFSQAGALVRAAIERFGRLDAVVNNAGIVRDRMFATTGETEWDTVVRVHLKGHFAVSRHAAAHWRDLAKSGSVPDARIVNTSSGAGLFGSVGQAAYSAAKAGIACLTLVQAAELGRYGVCANAIAPAARTRMTETVFADSMAAPPEPSVFDAMAPENVSPLVVWLVSRESADVTGQVFEMEGGRITVAEGWRRGPLADKGARFQPGEIGSVVRELLEKSAPPLPVYGSGSASQG